MNLSVKLKIKYDSHSALINLDTNSTIKQLIDEIRRVIDIGNEEMDLLSGFPPKPINKTFNLTLTEAKIKSGDCIILKKISNNEIKKPKLDNEQITPLNPVVNDNKRNCIPPTVESDIPKLNQLDSLFESQKNISATILTKQTIPSDNSCLFASVYYCLHDSSLVGFDSDSERQLISAMLLSQPDKFDRAFLEDKTPEVYCEWIMDTNRWGGSIELHLLSCVNMVEIDVVNIKSDRIDRFGEDQNYSYKILILYDGIHYDSLAQEDINTGKLISKYTINDNQVMDQAKQLAKELNSSKQFTDMHAFRIKCHDCNVIMVGQEAIVKHANNTGHSNFGEVN